MVGDGMIYNDILYNIVAIEVTRKCNMKCPHCLRGDAENVSIDINYLEYFLKNFRGCTIKELLLTGGEPTLEPKIVSEILYLLYKYDVNPYYISIITNGKGISKEFIDIINYWRSKNLTISVQVSLDKYHSVLSTKDIKNIEELNATGKYVNSHIYKIVSLGRAKNLDYAIERKVRDFLIYPYYNYLVTASPITLTVYGDVLRDCEYEFNSDCSNIKIGRYNDDIRKIIFDIGKTRKNLSDYQQCGLIYRWIEVLKSEGKINLS